MYITIFLPHSISYMFCLVCSYFLTDGGNILSLLPKVQCVCVKCKGTTHSHYVDSCKILILYPQRRVLALPI